MFEVEFTSKMWRSAVTQANQGGVFQSGLIIFTGLVFEDFNWPKLQEVVVCS